MNVLSPLGFVYGKISNVRNALYDRGVLPSYSLGARTISVGNITMGGTGKTPLVAYVSEILAESGETVCILTRGYGRQNPRERVLVSDGSTVLVDARTGGDEAVELGRKLIGKAIVVADAGRVAAAAWAKKQFGATAFVMDDAFQHRRAKRDLDIVCIDATNPSGSTGVLREPFSGLARADAIVITRSDLVEDVSSLVHRIEHVSSAPVFLARSIITSPGVDKRHDPAFALCGLGNPESFFELLRRGGFHLKGTRAFADHHYYTQSEVSELEHDARRSGADVLLTTAKDMVKLEKLNFDLPCHTVEIRPEIDDEATFRELVTSSKAPFSYPPSRTPGRQESRPATPGQAE